MKHFKLESNDAIVRKLVSALPVHSYAKTQHRISWSFFQHPFKSERSKQNEHKKMKTYNINLFKKIFKNFILLPNSIFQLTCGLQINRANLLIDVSLLLQLHSK